jgi:gas vesicle protein
MTKNNKLLTGLITGAIIGAVAGLLLAPKSGKETRQMLRERAAGLKQKAGGFGGVFSRGRSKEEAEESMTNGSAHHGRS